MFCYSVYVDSKQVKTFPYDALVPGDYRRARELARDFADHVGGTVERFGATDSGILDYTAGTYNCRQIARELLETAAGTAWHGNALRVACDIPCITPEQRSILQAYANGAAQERGKLSDRIALQEIAELVRVSCNAPGR